MTADQVHAAGAIVAAFAGVLCVVQIVTQRGIHLLWLLLLLVGLVAYGVTA